jgi:hypothetical protein
LSRRKDLERFLRLKQDNPSYQGFRGWDTVTEQQPLALESVVCSVCGRKRNVANDTIPEDPDNFVCMSCQGSSLPEGG